ncbi:Uncharacterised protein [Klebsiella michiganensis]|nr:Uncharacterised protein [Klebsiella michiganensis]
MQPDQPGSMRCAVTCTIRPRRASEERPSSQPTRSGGRVTDSKGHRQRQLARMQEERFNPSGRTISSLITRSSAALTSALGPLRSIKPAVCPRKVRNLFPSRTSTVAPLIALNGRARVNGQTPLIQPGFYISVAQTHERSPLRHCAPTPSGDKGKLASLCTLHNSFVLFKELTDFGLQYIDGDTVLTAARHDNIGILFGRVDKLQEHRAQPFSGTAPLPNPSNAHAR